MFAIIMAIVAGIAVVAVMAVTVDWTAETESDTLEIWDDYTWINGKRPE